MGLARGGAWDVPELAIPVIGTNGLGSRDFSRWCQSGLYRQRADDLAFFCRTGAAVRGCQGVEVSRAIEFPVGCLLGIMMGGKRGVPAPVNLFQSLQLYPESIGTGPPAPGTGTGSVCMNKEAPGR